MGDTRVTLWLGASSCAARCEPGDGLRAGTGDGERLPPCEPAAARGVEEARSARAIAAGSAWGALQLQLQCTVPHCSACAWHI